MFVGISRYAVYPCAVAHRDGGSGLELNVDEALRYLGIRGTPPEELRREAREVAGRLTAAIAPRYVYQVFPLEREGEAWRLVGAGAVLAGETAGKMLGQCSHAALLACTLGAEFDAMLRREQARDMSRAAILDACGGAWVEAGCGAAERELAGRLPGKYLTDRFSPGYGGLPLDLQPALCAALDAGRRLGLYETASKLLVPVKSVTAIDGIADGPQAARIRGCSHCALRERCAMRGSGCGL